MTLNTDQLQNWPDRRPAVPIHLAHEYGWAVAIISNGEAEGIFVHKNESSRDVEIQAGQRPGVSYVLVANLQAVDRRWKIAYHRSPTTRRRG